MVSAGREMSTLSGCLFHKTRLSPWSKTSALNVRPTRSLFWGILVPTTLGKVRRNDEGKKIFYFADLIEEQSLEDDARCIAFASWGSRTTIGHYSCAA
jgi:hypothetical protein